MPSFETRTALAGMQANEIRKFVGDFQDALLDLASMRIKETDVGVSAFAQKFDEIAGLLDWENGDILANAGIYPSWIESATQPHRIFLHPDVVTRDTMWHLIDRYLEISMISDKAAKVLFPNLVKQRRPKAVTDDSLLSEARTLNKYLHGVQESGLSGDRILAYRGDLRTHGQGQNDSGRIGAVGAVAAIVDAVSEIAPDAIVDTYGMIPISGHNSPVEIARQMRSSSYDMPKALLLSSQRAIIFSSDPDIAIVSRIGGERLSSAQEASEHWGEFRKRNADDRNAALHQVAFGEVKTALDKGNIHERLALGSRENRDEARAPRFLLMAILTNDIVDPERRGRRALFSPDARRFTDVFNLYFAWGYDNARKNHPEHWADFKVALKRWLALP